MNKYRIYRQDNYIVISNDLTKETQYGHVKTVFVDKSNANKASYRIFEVKDFDDRVSLVIDQILKEDGSTYTQSEFETFYTQNTGNFNSGGSGQGVQTVTGSSVDNTDPSNPIINAVEEAPIDGQIYGRQDGNWEVVSGGSGIPDAPADGELYGRKDNTWEVILTPTLEQVVDRNNGVTGDRNIYFENNDRLNNINANGSYISLNFSDYNINSIGIDQGAGTINKTYGALTLYISNIDGTDGKGSTLLANPSSTNIAGKFYLPVNGNSINEPITLATLEDLSPDITVTEDNVTIPDGTKTRMYTLTGTSPQVITLPIIANAIGSIYFITNDSPSSVTVDSNGGANDIWDSGVLVATKEVVSNTILRIINDGVNFKIL